MSFAPKNIPVARTEKTQGRSSWGLGISLAFLFALGAFISGMQIGRGVWVSSSAQPASLFSIFSANGQTKAAIETRPDLAEFWKVWDLLEEKFVVSSSTSKQTDEERIQGAIDGLVDSYDDPYTVYMPPADAEKFSEDISGNFSGVGMEVGLRDKIITVIAPLPDTPAERAGMMAGDAIVKINGSSTEDMSIDEAVSLIRGEKGTIVELQIYREGATEFQTISITRDTINIPTVRTEQVDGTFIIALYSFNAIAESEVAKALEEYTKSGAKTLAIDLRGNPGGFLQSAVAIASYFLPAGKVVVSEDFGGGKEGEVFRSRGRQIQHFTPQNLVVLVDGGSASASEILAGALKDHGVATVIGAQTFGKGSVQELVTLDDGASLKVTVARWLTPNGTSISDGGLSPDIVISRTIEDRQNNVDPQKEAAVRFLSGKTVISESSDSIEAGE
ncbi:S41 family peptidase [Candidatus Kaiserbacteria bacterium]|nr:S41 family peptidase [Candidatus Kaiserbacteria bacterium]USN88778.1 MAG: S41 family peptidase [Candidatus Nomurabacteria bacterium]